MRIKPNAGLWIVALAYFYSCNTIPDTGWKKLNNELIENQKLEIRSIENLPDNNIIPNLSDGAEQSIHTVDSLSLQDGIKAKLFWGHGLLVANLNITSNTKLQEETVPADMFVLVLEGQINYTINGISHTLKRTPRETPDGTHGGTPIINFIYIEKNSKRSFSTSENGAILMEVYSPIRLDYVQKAGIKNLPKTVQDLKSFSQTSVLANTVYDLYDIQLTKISNGAYARLITSKNAQLSFLSLDPGTSISAYIHPEEKISVLMRGECIKTVIDKQIHLKKDDILRISPNMVQAVTAGEFGSDMLDIYWPARTDFIDKQKESLKAFQAIIPEDARLELLVDGKKTKPELHFSEGPKWLNGKVYFSNMFFDQNFGASPAKSSTVELDPTGSYRNITEGKMQTNGLYPYKNGNLLVCDMMGHRIVEMNTKGKVLRVVADKYEGHSIDGPNDIVTDAKGGFYFTDPQFTMEAKKFQPGRAVYYVSPTGEVKRLVEPNEFAMPNGIVLSPDGKTLYINNCYDDESWFPVNSEKDNFVWAYDVQDDGTIKNGRKFAQLHLTGEMLDKKGKSSSADGMAIDKQGNIYVCTYSGVQIFDATGTFVGIINTPSFPVSLCFGDTDMKTLYIVSYSKVYKIRTNMVGYINYL